MKELESLKVSFEINGQEHKLEFFQDYLNYQPEASVIDESGETTYERPKRYYFIPNIVRSELMAKIGVITGDTPDDFNRAIEQDKD